MRETSRPPNPMFPPSLAEIASGSPRAMEEFARMEVHLDLPEGFILELLKGADDWTFILRLHALVESALEYLIVANLARPELDTWVIRHNIGGRTGKLALASALGVVDDADRGMVEGLADIRNRFAHRVQMTATTFGDYWAELPVSERTKLTRWIVRAYGYATSGPLDEAAANAWQTSPRLVLWVACRALIERAYEVRRSARHEQISAAFGICTEDGHLLTTEGGDVLVTEDAPDLDQRPPRSGPSLRTT